MSRLMAKYDSIKTKKTLDVSKKEAPYGVVINTETKEREYHDIDEVFYSNKAEVETLQEEISTKFKAKEKEDLNKLKL